MASEIEPKKEKLDTARLPWSAASNPEFIRNLQNTVYSLLISGEPAILRLTNPAHRDSMQLHQELEWVLFLSDNGCNVARPIESANGRLVEKVQYGNDDWLGSVFSFAFGRPIEEPGVLSSKTLFAWGRELAKIHNSAMSYEPQNVRGSHQSLDKYRLDVSSHITANGGVLSTIARLNRWIDSLPKGSSEYGMIHGDSVNFHIHDGRVTFFDFDDCAYHWFAFDIANGLYSLSFIIQNEDIDFELSFEECVGLFVQGYRTVKTIEQVWVDRIPCFVNYRTALLSQWLKTPEVAPRWVLDIEDEWRNKLEIWIEKCLDSELELV